MKFLLSIFSILFISYIYGELFFTPQMIATHLESYTEEELKLIKKDLNIVRSICLENTHNTDTRFYLATAGAPGSRKTTILEKFVASRPEFQEGVYLDPDPRALKFMAHTYYAQSLTPFLISQTENFEDVLKNAYEKWRPASNYIALTLFEEAVGSGRSIIYGATSTGSHISNFFTKLKENGYQIILLLCSCPDDVRKKAVEYRNQVLHFYQSSPEDAIAKGKFFPQRMRIYFAHADILYFFWSDDLFSAEKLAAVWKKGNLEIRDSKAMDSFAEKYEADRISLSTEGQVIPHFSSYFEFPSSEK